MLLSQKPGPPPGPAVPCCPGCVLSAWFGVIILVPFSSLSACAGLPALPLPPFLRPPSPRLPSLHPYPPPPLPPPPRPRPSLSCRCVHSAALRVCRPPRPPPAPLIPAPPAGTPLPAPVTPPHSVAPCTDFSISVFSSGVGPAQSLVQPALVWRPRSRKGGCVRPPPTASPVSVSMFMESRASAPSRPGASAGGDVWVCQLRGPIRDAPLTPGSRCPGSSTAAARWAEEEASRRPACR